MKDLVGGVNREQGVGGGGDDASSVVEVVASITQNRVPCAVRIG